MRPYAALCGASAPTHVHRAQKQSLLMVQHGLNYLLNCYAANPTDYANSEGDVYIYQVGDIALERSRWLRPEDIKVRSMLRDTCASCITRNTARTRHRTGMTRQVL
jgi:hypothetical protein